MELEQRVVGKLEGEDGCVMVKVYMNGMYQWLTFDTREEADQFIKDNFM